MMLRLKKIKNNFIFVLFFIISALIPVNADENSQIAALYISAADSFYRNNQIDQAEIFINKALVFNSDISDPYYIRAMINLAADKNLNNSASLLKKSILLRNWKIYNENKALFELGKLYTIMKDYNRAVSSFYVIEEHLIDNQEFIDYYSSALINSGFINMAADILKYSVVKFPLNTVFKKRLINLDSSYREQILMNILDQNNIYNFDNELIVEVLKAMNDHGVKKELINLLEEKGSENPEIIIEKARINIYPGKQDIDLFIQQKGLENYRLIRAVIPAIKDDTLKRYLISKLESYTGFIRDDINSDGTYERISKINNGRYEWFSEDMNQDGINDFFIDFQDGKPGFINVKDNIMIVFSSYPFLKAVLKFEDNFSEIFTFPEKRAFFDVVEFSELHKPPLLKTEINNAVNEIIKKAENYQKNIEDDKITILREYFKTDRISYFEHIDTSLNIVTRGIKKDGVEYYAESDMLLNNNFETKEFYRDGILRTISYDGNSNGIFEFKIEDNIKYWDYDEDGIYDAKEWTGDDGFRYSMFSTLLNGIFDITAKYRNNELLEIKRDTEWFNVSFDSVNDIYWIGTPCSGFTAGPGLKNSTIIKCGDNNIKIIKAGSKYFAEVIN